MALVTEQIFTIGEAHFSLIYDDTTGTLSAVVWDNSTSRDWTVRASLPDGSRSWTGTIAANTNGQVSAPTQQNRRLAYIRGAGSGDSDPTAWVRTFNISVGG